MYRRVRLEPTRGGSAPGAELTGGLWLTTGMTSVACSGSGGSSSLSWIDTTGTDRTWVSCVAFIDADVAIRVGAGVGAGVGVIS
jgi:hypothetical protein